MNHEPNRMEQHDSQPSFVERVRARLESGVEVRPRRYFVMRGVLLAVGTALVALALLYLASLIVFSLRASGAWFAPSAGWRGLGALLRSLPWLVLALAAAFVVVLEVMVQRYAVAYRRPLLYSAVAVVALVAIGTFVLSRTPLHPAAFRSFEAGHLPIAAPMYRGLGEASPSGVRRGVVTQVNADGFVLTTRRGQAILVATGTGTNVGAPSPLVVGDMVLVLGELDDGAVAAWDVRVIPDDLPLPPPGMMTGERYRRERPY